MNASAIHNHFIEPAHRAVNTKRTTVTLSNPSGALAGDVDGDSDFDSLQDVRDHNHGNRSNWDVICDVGTSIKQTSVADALTNYRLNGDADHNGLTSDITVGPKIGVINGPLINPIIDPNETYDDAVQSLIDDMMTGYRLKDVIITSFDNADAITNGGSTSLQENCANGTFLQANYANGNWLDKSSTKYSPGKGASFGAKQGEGWTIIESMVNQDNMQGLDAGGMNNDEAVGLDSSTVDVVNTPNSICGGCGRHGTPWQADV